MPGTRVIRPIVRSFTQRFAREAARHVRAGGHAIVWENPTRALLVIPAPDDEADGDLGYWSILDLGKKRYRVESSGPFRGLGTTLVPRDCHQIVRDRYERDSVFPGATRKVVFDCLACGACCKDNDVILFKEDVERFKAGGQEKLAMRPWARKKDGKLVLVLLENKHCQHLQGDNKCGIYAIRPDACSTFPVASECCLYAREEELGIIDGDRTHVRPAVTSAVTSSKGARTRVGPPSSLKTASLE